MMTVKSVDTKKCDYCLGNGYFQLLLGGSETCSCCGGSGKKKD
ncbi:DnaJ-class molecular chaperone [Bacillus sp. SLBN-46]|nr:DnaJ-class molecular chaperone [Bacillus sp. SLBN-46]